MTWTVGDGCRRPWIGLVVGPEYSLSCGGECPGGPSSADEVGDLVV